MGFILGIETEASEISAEGFKVNTGGSRSLYGAFFREDVRLLHILTATHSTSAGAFRWGRHADSMGQLTDWKRKKDFDWSFNALNPPSAE